MTTPDTIAADIANAEPGATLVLEPGVYLGLPLKYRKPNLTLDCTAATITGDTRTTNLDGLTVIGGRFTGGAPFNFYGGKNFAIRGAKFIGPQARVNNAITVQSMTGVTVTDCEFDTFVNGVTLAGVSNGVLVNTTFRNMRKDMVHAAGVWNLAIREFVGHGTDPQDGDHPDGIQIRNLPDRPPSCDITMEGVTLTGKIQGVVTTHKTGDGGFDRITLRRARICAGHPNGAGFIAVRSLILDDVEVKTLPGSPYLSKVYVDPTCSDVVMSKVSYAPYRAKRGLILAA